MIKSKVISSVVIFILIITIISFERWANFQISECLTTYLQRLEQIGFVITNKSYKHGFFKATNNFTIALHNVVIPVTQKISIGPVWPISNDIKYGLAKIQTCIDGTSYGNKESYLKIQTVIDFQKKIISRLSDQLLTINFNKKSLTVNIKGGEHSAVYPFLKQQQTLILDNIVWLAEETELSKIAVNKTKLITSWELTKSGRAVVENIVDINDLQILDLSVAKKIVTNFKVDFLPSKLDADNTKVLVKNLLFNLAEQQTLSLQGDFAHSLANFNFKLSENLIEKVCIIAAKEISKGLANKEIEINKNMIKQLIVKTGFVKKEQSSYIAETIYDLESRQLIINNCNISKLITPYLNNFLADGS